jgi:hypothetical protein
MEVKISNGLAIPPAARSAGFSTMWLAEAPQSAHKFPDQANFKRTLRSYQRRDWCCSGTLARNFVWSFDNSSSGRDHFRRSDLKAEWFHSNNAGFSGLLAEIEAGRAFGAESPLG